MHKKHYPNGVPASKILKEKGSEDLLRKSFPGLDLSWPGLRVLHLDPPVLTVDGFFSDAECDAYRALEHATETGDAHMLAQSATFSGASDARTSTTWLLKPVEMTAALARGSTTRPPLPQPWASALPLLLGSGSSPFEATRQPSRGRPETEDLRPNPLTDKELRSRFERADVDKNGTLDFQEFQARTLYARTLYASIG